MTTRFATATAMALAVTSLALPGLAAAQDASAPPATDAEAAESVDAAGFTDGSALDGDFLTIGVGGGLTPSYDGSDDYVLTPVPLVQGSLGGIGISPRPGGVALDFINDGDGDGPYFNLGPALRIRANRTGNIQDEVVELLPERDTAIEVGASAGVSFPGVLHGFDTLSLSTDVRWDVAGAHDGMVVEPSISYLTPLSQGTVAILGVSASWADDDFADYYYTVTPADALASGLPAYDAEGGLRSAGVTLLVAQDLNGNVLDGGLSLFAIGGYTRLLNDAADNPLTEIRGSADQFLGGLGLAYTF